MSKTIRSHIKGVLGYWKLDGATNVSMEGFNGNPVNQHQKAALDRSHE